MYNTNLKVSVYVMSMIPLPQVRAMFNLSFSSCLPGYSGSLSRLKLYHVKKVIGSHDVHVRTHIITFKFD